MAEDYVIEEWLICPRCDDECIKVQYYNGGEGLELICETCGLRSHKTGDEMNVDSVL